MNSVFSLKCFSCLKEVSSNNYCEDEGRYMCFQCNEKIEMSKLGDCCVNKERGCSFTNPESLEMLLHLAECNFKLKTCPQRTEGCRWRGPLGMLVKHYIEIHPGGVFLLTCPLRGEGCNWTGPRTLLTKHYIENHKTNL